MWIIVLTYFIIRGIYECGRNSAIDSNRKKWANDKGYDGYYGCDGNWHELK